MREEFYILLCSYIRRAEQLPQLNIRWAFNPIPIQALPQPLQAGFPGSDLLINYNNGPTSHTGALPISTPEIGVPQIIPKLDHLSIETHSVEVPPF